jgi:hypothetical protein
MKNQYFGDNRDLFKFDLVDNILKKRLVTNVFYVPMLTADDESKKGNRSDRKKAEAGFKNKKLVKFLDECIATGKRNVMQLQSYFPDMTIESGSFNHIGRIKYFQEVLKTMPTNALILVDPDTGIQPLKSEPGERHVLNFELKNIYEKMDAKSILMVYQHYPRVQKDDFLHDSCHVFADSITGNDPICVFDSKNVFFIVTKSQKIEEKLIDLIGEYSESYS